MERSADPVAFGKVSDEGESGFFGGFQDIGPVLLDDAGDDPGSAGFDDGGDIERDGDEGGGDDVGHHHVIGCALGKDGGAQSGDGLEVDSVQLGVLFGDL